VGNQPFFIDVSVLVLSDHPDFLLSFSDCLVALALVSCLGHHLDQAGGVIRNFVWHWMESGFVVRQKTGIPLTNRFSHQTCIHNAVT